MNISNYNNISFGQKVPTASLLKMGAGVYDFEDARNLCSFIDNRFPGNVGYYKKAVKYANSIAQKNENVSQMLESLKELPSKKDKLTVIRKMVMATGSEIDVVI